jgi:hypothetical protein
MGFALAIGSSLTEAVRLVMTDFLLSGVKMKVLESLYYLSPAGGACLFAVGCAIEGPLLLAKGHQYRPLQHPFTFLAAASMGLGVQLLTTHVRPRNALHASPSRIWPVLRLSGSMAIPTSQVVWAHSQSLWAQVIKATSAVSLKVLSQVPAR